MNSNQPLKEYAYVPNCNVMPIYLNLSLNFEIHSHAPYFFQPKAFKMRVVLNTTELIGCFYHSGLQLG